MLTLAQIALASGAAYDRVVIDQFRKSSFLLDSLVFDPAAAQTGGASWDYSWNLLTTQPTANFRALGSDYVPSETVSEGRTVSCAVLGGSFTVDRATANLANGAKVAFEIEQKVKATKALFADTVINGDKGVDANAFDGLSVMLAGTTTEIGADAATQTWDITAAAVTTQAQAIAACEELDTLLGSLDSMEGAALLMNTKALTRLRSIARLAGYYSPSEDAFGRSVDKYNGVPMVDLGEKSGTSDPVIGTTAGVTEIYAVRFAQDGLHGVAPAGYPLVATYLPKFDNGNSQAVQQGSVEMVATVALRQTKAAAVRRNVKVA